MKIAVFGGTGALGQAIVAQAVAAGHHVVVLARTPDKMKFAHDNLKLIQGDGLDKEAVSRAVEGQDAVLCAVGGADLKDATTRTKVTENILSAMAHHQVSSVVICSSLGAGKSKPQLSLLGRMVVSTLLRHAIGDQTAQEALVQKSDLDWTIVRPPRLIDGEKTERYRLAEEGESFTGSQISRSDVAHFMLRVLEEKKWARKAMAISL